MSFEDNNRMVPVMDHQPGVSRSAAGRQSPFDSAASNSLRQVLESDPPQESVVDDVAHQQLGDVHVVTLARPEALNALSLAAWKRVATLFEAIARDDQARAVVVRGAGERAFAAGADIAEFPEVRIGTAASLHYSEAIGAAVRSVAGTPMPVIAMVHGLAVGGGCELAAGCDVRVAAMDARFGVPIGRLGVTLGYTEADALARLIGPAALKYLLFSGRLIGADEALRLGLVQRTVPAEELVTETLGLVDNVCASSEVTIRAGKLVADMTGRALDAEDTELLTRLAVEAYDGPDLPEGVAAFQEKRQPKFTGKRGDHARS